MLQRERERIVVAARRLAEHGLVIGTAGNVSQRAGALVAITPTGASLERLTPDEIPVIDLRANHIAGDLAPTSEIQLHLGIYRRFDAGAVVHTHAPMATALSCVLTELPVVHYQMLAFGGSVRVAPYETFGTDRLSDAALSALVDRRVALMSNHGAIAYADDVEAAVEHSLLLEWACTLYWRAAAIGTPRVLGDAEQREFIRTVAERRYGSKRRVNE
jgi:L-fuculose-phosphate aldolase